MNRKPHIKDDFRKGTFLIDKDHPRIYVANGSDWIVSLFGNVNTRLSTNASHLKTDLRAATKEEVFADLDKNGWSKQGNTIKSPQGWIYITYYEGRGWFHVANMPHELEKISPFGKECVMTKIIIDGLNLQP